MYRYRSLFAITFIGATSIILFFIILCIFSIEIAIIVSSLYIIMCSLVIFLSPQKVTYEHMPIIPPIDTDPPWIQKSEEINI